jgi:hypothetical protein
LNPVFGGDPDGKPGTFSLCRPIFTAAW